MLNSSSPNENLCGLFAVAAQLKKEGGNKKTVEKKETEGDKKEKDGRKSAEGSKVGSKRSRSVAEGKKKDEGETKRMRTNSGSTPADAKYDS